MAYIHNLFNDVPVINNMIHAISSFKMKVEVKNGDTGKWEPAPETVRLIQILTPDRENAPNLLGEILSWYLIYGNATIYKLKTRRAMIHEIDESEPTKSYNYKDGMVAGLNLIKDEDGYVDKNGMYHISEFEQGGMTGSRKNLKPNEYIYIDTWNPNKDKPISSIGRQAERVVYGINKEDTIGSIMGVDEDLVQQSMGNPYAGSQERREVLIKRAFEDTIIPLAEKFIGEIQRQIGLADNMRIVLDSGDRDEWVKAWGQIVWTGEEYA